MIALRDRLPLPEKRAAIIADCTRLLDDEVRRKKGVSGLAIRAGYKVLKAFKSNAIPDAIDGLLDDFIDSLDPLHESYLEDARGASSLGGFLEARRGETAEALVGVTDRRAEKSRHTTLVKGYRKLRPIALDHVSQAVPGLAALFDRYYQPA
ncbi:MAG: hypothetical protein JXR96_20315 [Deltaproteobacteria bacterium]|nr:hypothetical protein [Deltaproteobacteria bacterium]